MSISARLKIFVLSLLLLSVPFSGVAKTFSDVPHFHKNVEAIHHLSDLGIINGYPNGTFQPSQTITRAEAAKLLVASTKPAAFINEVRDNLLHYAPGTVPFFDVQLNEWYAPYVSMAQQYGIVNGYPDGSFQPARTINFAEGLKMILEAYGAETWSSRHQDHTLLYVKSTDWFSPYFMYAHNKNLISKQKFYHPAQPMTRGDFAEVVYRIKTMKENNWEQFERANNAFFSEEYTVTIPKLSLVNINVGFADPYDSRGALQILNGGLGHYLAPPGSGRKLVLFGHSSGFNWDTSAFKQILRQIDQLQDGDRVYINYQEKGYVYEINRREVMPAGNLVNVMGDSGYEELAMYTCWPPDSVSHRYVVYATPVL